MKKYLLTVFILSLMCLVSEARVIRGSVTCSDKKLSGVLVTDGKSFTKTKKNGTFRLNICDTAKFVYVVTPSGYTADWSDGTPAFYKRAEGQSSFVFDLKPYGDTRSSYNIIAVADPQPTTVEHFNKFAGVPLEDIRQSVSSLKSPSVGIVLGDITFDKYAMMKNWKKEIVRAGIPFYPVIGNHDHNRNLAGDSESASTYEASFGPANYAFFIGSDLVIVLDNIIYKTKKKYTLGYTDGVISWVRSLMKHVPADADIYVAQHASLNGRHYRGMIPGHDTLLGLFDGHKVTFLSGHNHTNGVFEYAPGVMEHNVAAICGTWWDVYHCTDGTPRGYKVLTKEGGRLSWYYKSIGRDRNFQFEVYRPGQTRLHPESIVVNVWDYDPSWKVEWYQDGRPMGAMKQVEDYSPIHEADMKARYAALGKEPSRYRKTRKSGHFFAAVPSPDVKAVTVVVTDRFGNRWEEVIENIF